MSVKVKICGVTTPAIAAAACEAGAAYIGLVFYPGSPRALGFSQAAAIRQSITDKVQAVGLFVDPTEDQIEQTLAHVKLDMIQLHGRENPERVEALRRFGVPLIKAMALAQDRDLAAIAPFEDVADMMLFDAPPPLGTSTPGGNGIAFDWSLLAGNKCKRSWMLSGGLTASNVRQAVALSGARIVDVSSGVEITRGVKNADLIRKFVAEAGEA